MSDMTSSLSSHAAMEAQRSAAEYKNQSKPMAEAAKPQESRAEEQAVYVTASQTAMRAGEMNEMLDELYRLAEISPPEDSNADTPKGDVQGVSELQANTGAEEAREDGNELSARTAQAMAESKLSITMEADRNILHHLMG